MAGIFFVLIVIGLLGAVGLILADREGKARNLFCRNCKHSKFNHSPRTNKRRQICLNYNTLNDKLCHCFGNYDFMTREEMADEDTSRTSSESLPR